MQKTVSILNNDRGSLIFVAMIFLALLTLIGISAIDTSTTEVKIASNFQLDKINFYVADSGWKPGAMWLDGQAGPPPYINSAGTVVRNYGGGVQDVFNDDFQAGTQDSPSNFSAYGIPYWYRVSYLPNDTSIVPGSGKNYWRHFYKITSHARRTRPNPQDQEVEVIVSKIFKTGYN